MPINMHFIPEMSVVYANANKLLVILFDTDPTKGSTRTYINKLVRALHGTVRATYFSILNQFFLAINKKNLPWNKHAPSWCVIKCIHRMKYEPRSCKLKAKRNDM